jgi:hypothetical protein
MVARVSAETSASAELNEVCRWLIRTQFDPVRLDVDDLPALGQGSRLSLGRPITAPLAVLCAICLLEDAEEGGCLLVGQLRFVAHPIASEIKLSFNGRTSAAMSVGLVHRQAEHAARQLLDVIAAFITHPPALGRLAQAAS